MGNGSVIQPGDVQRMTAGTGVRHSEQNASDQEQVHLLQIWILPNQKNLEPGYEQTSFSIDERKNRLRLVASPSGKDGSVMVHQDASLFASIMESGIQLDYAIDQNRYA